MTAQRAGGVDDATQSVSETTDKGTQEKPKVNSFAAALLEDARGMGHLIGDPKIESSKVEETETAETTDEVTDETPEVTDEEETPSTEETTEETEADEKAEETQSDKKTIDEQINEFEARGEKPPWYLTRIQSETRKKNDRTTERDRALERATELQGKIEDLEKQLERSAIPQANGSNPILNVWTETDIRNLQGECKKWISWAARNPQGGEAVIGKDEQGNDVVKELDAEATTNLKLAAEETLREGIPARREFLAARQKANSLAVEIYPDLKDADSALSMEVNAYLRETPALQLIPDIKIWLGHAIRGRNLFLAERNGKATRKVETTTSRVVASAKTKVAPKMPVTRGFVPRTPGADLDKAKKTLAEKGTQEAGEEYLAQMWANKGRSKQVERVE